MMTFETDQDLRTALQIALGTRIDGRLFEECRGDLHSPYSEADFREILKAVRARRRALKRTRKGRKSPQGQMARVLRAIAQEVSLWQELQLHEMEPQLAEVRKRLLGSRKKAITEIRAEKFLAGLLESKEATIRPAYVELFLERSVLPQDYWRYLEDLQPNDLEYFLAAVAFVMNRAYLSGTEAMYYLLTGRRILIPALFNPTIVLVTYRLALYLQPPGRPSRSLLSEREKALLWLVGSVEGIVKWSKLCGQWNREHPEWAYVSWRSFRKAYQRANRRLLITYDMPFQYEQRQKDPTSFWQWLKEMTSQASG